MPWPASELHVPSLRRRPPLEYLFDKGLLACIVLAVGAFANRYLERYRGDMALSTEGAKVRLAKIGELWEEASLWEADAKLLFIDFTPTAVRELQAANLEGVPQEGEGEHEHSIKLLLRLPADLPIPQSVLDALETQILPQSQALAARAQNLGRQIHRYRFWLKDDLYRSMRQYHFQMQEAAVALQLSPEGIESGRQAFAKLNEARQNVDTIIGHILARPKRRLLPRWITRSST